MAAGQTYEFDSDCCGVMPSVRACHMAPSDLLEPLVAPLPVAALAQRAPGFAELRVLPAGTLSFVVRRALFLQQRFRAGGFLKRRLVRPVLTARPVLRLLRGVCALPAVDSPGAKPPRRRPAFVAPRFAPASWCARAPAQSPVIADFTESCWSSSHVLTRSLAGGRRARRVLVRRLGPGLGPRLGSRPGSRPRPSRSSLPREG